VDNNYSHMKKWLIIGAALVVFFVEVPAAYAGFGITPPYVRNDKLTQGSSYTQEIILVRGDPVEDLKAEITVNVPGIDGWFTIDRGTEFLLPKGETQVPMHVTVTVPPDAKYDRYQGTIRIRTVSPDPASGVSIALGAQVDVDLRVVDEIRDFEVKRVQISETEEPRRVWWLEYPGKITFTMGIENTGNAPTSPSKVQLDIYDKRGNVILETTSNTNTLENVLPFETRDVVAYLPTRLPPGAYLVKYAIYRFEGEAKREGELTLSVLPRGTLAAYAGYGLDGLSRGDLLSVVVPVVLVLIVLIALALLSRRRSGRPHRKHRRSRSDDDDRPPSRRDQHATRSVQRPPPQGHAVAHGVVDLSRHRKQR
jgi:hypothetical protein